MSQSDSSPSRSPVREVQVQPDRSGQRLDNFLMHALGGIPRSLVYRLIRTGQVRVNGGRAKPMRKLVTGDRVRLPPVAQPNGSNKSVPPGVREQIRRRIVHSQNEFVVVNKPAGLASQAGSGLDWGLDDVLASLDKDLLPVHRLDRQTSGLMVFARGRKAAKSLQQAFQSTAVGDRADKRYFALLCGCMPEDLVVLDWPLKKIRDRSGQHRVIVADDGQQARSTFKRLETFAEHDYVEVRIDTGRTHQIRVHAAALGCPVVGDGLYNDSQDDEQSAPMFLHAGMLRLPWPEDQVFHAPLPDELNQVLNSLRRG